MPAPDAFATLASAWPEIVGDALAGARGGALGSRRRVHDRGRRTRLGDPVALRRNTRSWSARERCCGRAVVTSIRVVVTGPGAAASRPGTTFGAPRFWYTERTGDTPSDQAFRVPDRGVRSTLTRARRSPPKGSHAWRTRPRTSRFSRASSPCASGPACTSAPPVPRACTTSSTRSSTTRSTRRSRATRPASTSRCSPTAAAGWSTTAAGSRSIRTPNIPTSRRPRSCSRCSTPAASSAARATRSPAACTASACRS